MKKYNIDKDIRHAATLPASFYRSEATFDEVSEKVFGRCWQYAMDRSEVEEVCN